MLQYVHVGVELRRGTACACRHVAWLSTSCDASYTIFVNFRGAGGLAAAAAAAGGPDGFLPPPASPRQPLDDRSCWLLLSQPWDDTLC